MFESDSFRRGLGERLTEAVVQEIQQRTPFRVVGPGGADSVLRGRLTNETKRLVLNSPTDEPRVVEIRFRAEVTWVNRLTGEAHFLGEVPIPTGIAAIDRAVEFVPETGQSVATAQQSSIDEVAQRIVDLMEKPW